MYGQFEATGAETIRPTGGAAPAPPPPAPGTTRPSDATAPDAQRAAEGSWGADSTPHAQADRGAYAGVFDDGSEPLGGSLGGLLSTGSEGSLPLGPGWSLSDGLPSLSVGLRSHPDASDMSAGVRGLLGLSMGSVSSDLDFGGGPRADRDARPPLASRPSMSHVAAVSRQAAEAAAAAVTGISRMIDAEIIFNICRDAAAFEGGPGPALELLRAAPVLGAVHNEKREVDLPFTEKGQKVTRVDLEARFPTPEAAKAALSSRIPLNISVCQKPTAAENKVRKKRIMRGEQVEEIPYIPLVGEYEAVAAQLEFEPLGLSRNPCCAQFRLTARQEFIKACASIREFGVDPASASNKVRNTGFRQRLLLGLSVPGGSGARIVVRLSTAAPDGYVVVHRDVTLDALRKAALAVPARLRAIQHELPLTRATKDIFDQAGELQEMVLQVDERSGAVPGPMYALWWDKAGHNDRKDKKTLHAHTWRIVFLALQQELPPGSIERCGFAKSNGGGAGYDVLSNGCGIDRVIKLHGAPSAGPLAAGGVDVAVERSGGAGAAAGGAGGAGVAVERTSGVYVSHTATAIWPGTTGADYAAGVGAVHKRGMASAGLRFSLGSAASDLDSSVEPDALPGPSSRRRLADSQRESHQQAQAGEIVADPFDPKELMRSLPDVS